MWKRSWIWWPMRWLPPDHAFDTSLTGSPNSVRPSWCFYQAASEINCFVCTRSELSQNVCIIRRRFRLKTSSYQFQSQIFRTWVGKSWKNKRFFRICIVFGLFELFSSSWMLFSQRFSRCNVRPSSIWSIGLVIFQQLKRTKMNKKKGKQLTQCNCYVYCGYYYTYDVQLTTALYKTYTD